MTTAESATSERPSAFMDALSSEAASTFSTYRLTYSPSSHEVTLRVPLWDNAEIFVGQSWPLQFIEQAAIPVAEMARLGC